MNLQRTPAIEISWRPNGESLVLQATLRVFGDPPSRIDETDCDRPGIESEARPQGFQGALFGAPKQSQELRTIRRSYLRDQRLLFGREVIRKKSIAARLDHFQIATKHVARCRNGTGRCASPMTD